MDLEKIKSVVLNQLTGVNGLYSLKLQNHIYGCFIIMEDIAQGTLDVSENIISTPKFSFDLDGEFGNIGIRYGFAMESKLVLDTYSKEYKEQWLGVFKDIDLQREINEVDKIEDCIIEVLQKEIKSDDAFFLSSLDTGALPQDWIEKAFGLINEVEEDSNKTLLSKAQTEKPLRTKKRLAVTRRNNNNNKIVKNVKKSLSKTRRVHFS